MVCHKRNWDTEYRERPADSASKLNTYRDGARILWTIAVLIKEERPLVFFSTIFGLLATASVVLAYPIFIRGSSKPAWYRVYRPRFSRPGMMLMAFISLASGFILDTVTRGRRELKRLFYLTIPGPDARRFGE